jgi:hypothetical protein
MTALRRILAATAVPLLWSSQVVAQTSSGTGFIVSRTGVVVTAYHVIADTDIVQVHVPGRPNPYNADVLRGDPVNDLAVLKIRDFPQSTDLNSEPPFALSSSPVRVGQTCFTLGYPLAAVLGTTPRLASGTINSTLGVRDDPRALQISNPIQPGNSGGPLVTEEGFLVGVVVSGLDAKLFLDKAGILPQNVNFAIKTAYLRPLLDDIQLVLRERSPLQGLPLDKQVERITAFTVQIVAMKSTTAGPAVPGSPVSAPGRNLDVELFRLKGSVKGDFTGHEGVLKIGAGRLTWQRTDNGVEKPQDSANFSVPLQDVRKTQKGKRKGSFVVILEDGTPHYFISGKPRVGDREKGIASIDGEQAFEAVINAVKKASR